MIEMVSIYPVISIACDPLGVVNISSFKWAFSKIFQDSYKIYKSVETADMLNNTKHQAAHLNGYIYSVYTSEASSQW